MEKAQVTYEVLQKWRRNGRYFGYKACCIDWFCGEWGTRIVWEKDEIEHSAYIKRKRHVNVGYIPCPKCLEILEMEEPWKC